MLALSITNPTTFNLLNEKESRGFLAHLNAAVQAAAAASCKLGVIGRGAFACAITTDDIERCASELMATLGQPIRLGSSRLFIRLHLATTEADLTDPADSLRELLITLNALEAEPAGAWRRYDANLRADLHYRYTLEQDLFHALRRNELFFQIQPQHRTANGALLGGELLSRWRHRTHGLIAPDEFIDMAERTGIIREIGEWVLASGIAMAKMVEDRGARISINISPRQFALQDLAQRVAHLLESSGVNPALIELEITESSVMQQMERRAADAQGAAVARSAHRARRLRHRTLVAVAAAPSEPGHAEVRSQLHREPAR